MAQSKKHSLIESLVNSGTGYLLAMAMNYYLVPMIYTGAKATAGGAFWLTAIFTALSIVRTYIVRRGFARMEERRAIEAQVEANALKLSAAFGTDPDHHRS